MKKASKLLIQKCVSDLAVWGTVVYFTLVIINIILDGFVTAIVPINLIGWGSIIVIGIAIIQRKVVKKDVDRPI